MKKKKPHANKKLQSSWLNRLGPEKNSPSPVEKCKLEFLLVSITRASKLDISDLLLVQLQQREPQVYQKNYSIISISHIVVQSRI